MVVVVDYEKQSCLLKSVMAYDIYDIYEKKKQETWHQGRVCHLII